MPRFLSFCIFVFLPFCPFVFLSFCLFAFLSFCILSFQSKFKPITDSGVEYAREMRFVTRVQTGFKPGAQSKIIRNARRQTLHCICNFLEAKNKKTYFRESPKSKSQTFMKFKNHRFYDLFDHYIKLKVHFFLRLFWGLG